LTDCRPSEQQPNQQAGDVSAAAPELELPTIYESIDPSTTTPDVVYLRLQRPENVYENADAIV